MLLHNIYVFICFPLVYTTSLDWPEVALITCESSEAGVYIKFHTPTQIQHYDEVKLHYKILNIKEKRKWVLMTVVQPDLDQTYIKAKVGQLYTDFSTILVFQFMMSIKTANETQNITKFHFKNMTKTFTNWKFEKAYSCFQKHGIQHLAVGTTCQQLSMTWVNFHHDTDEYMNKQSIEIYGDLPKDKYQWSKEIDKSRYCKDNICQYENPNILKVDTEYKVCVTSRFAEKNIVECRKIYSCCKQESIPLSVVWKETLLICLGILCSVLVVILVTVSVYSHLKRKTKSTTITDENELLEPRVTES